MRLTDLTRDLVRLPDDRDPEISGLTADSRAVTAGSIFAALPGVKQDGRQFASAAAKAGAAAILTDAEGAARMAGLGLPILTADNPRRALALMAARLHGPQPRIVAAVTGTNGKTSTASFLRQIWAHTGHAAASLGTLGLEGPAGFDLSQAFGMTAPAMTTPDPVSLQVLLAALASRGINHTVMEASSHGLDQYRLDGVRVSAAAFTNITQDHLDYHGSMDRYLAAKLRLFTDLLAPGGQAVINADSPAFDQVAEASRKAGHAIIDFGLKGKALALADRHMTSDGQTLDLEVLGKRHTVVLPLVGAFQASNALAALGLAVATGIAADAAVAALAHLSGVRGRVERVVTLDNGASVFVDYAHTPDGLEKVLMALRPHAENRLVVVFGAGGDRDRTKRPLMGRVAAKLADEVIVTDDNPRSENPAAIRAEILVGCPDATEIGDRSNAIAEAMGGLEAGDLLVIAGKGHEQGQIVGSVVHPFDDAEVARSVALGLHTGARI
ncbi:MAG TPA: UDP-N-acetylmuramoyl-L-alanyl-D-glutamate--2,6-diaminopimelate ligase [Stellaceae bacterium]|nr:UDP-N-acetylmuramoyl-L-alanyl-D-glutamate--2,6-diaminopimelate ligase [Stellaceae bacterium]